MRQNFDIRFEPRLSGGTTEGRSDFRLTPLLVSPCCEPQLCNHTHQESATVNHQYLTTSLRISTRCAQHNCSDSDPHEVCAVPAKRRTNFARDSSSTCTWRFDMVSSKTQRKSFEMAAGERCFIHDVEQSNESVPFVTSAKILWLGHQRVGCRCQQISLGSLGQKLILSNNQSSAIMCLMI